MPTSISKAQAKALASGFLDTLGNSDDKENLAINNTVSALIQLAGGFVIDANENLIKADRVASGGLSSSFKIMNPEQNGKNIQVDVMMDFYGQFVNAGVKGTKGGSGTYVFKNEGVSKKMLFAIRKWLIREGLKARTIRNEKLKASTAKKISKRETKRKSISETSNSIAYAIAKSIKQKGLKKTGFLDKAVATTEARAQDELGAAFKVDVINTLPKKLNDNTK